jgi:hypothetical protein
VVVVVVVVVAARWCFCGYDAGRCDARLL